jgi:hypothetical protein
MNVSIALECDSVVEYLPSIPEHLSSVSSMKRKKKREREKKRREKKRKENVTRHHPYKNVLKWEHMNF